MKTKLFKLLLLCFVLCFSCKEEQILTANEQVWLAKNPNAVVSIYGYVPPYLFNNREGKADGIFIDYLELIERKMDYKFKRVTYEKWPKLYNDAVEGKVDIVLDIPKTSEREKYFDFYGDFFSSKYVIVSKSDNIITNINLAQKRVVVPEGYAIIELLRKKIPDVDLHILPDEKECLERLSKGEFDAYLGPKLVAKNFIHELNISNLTISDVTPFYYRPVISVTKKNAMLSGIMGKVINSITNEEKQIIVNNWLYDEVKPFYKKVVFWIAVICLLGIITASNAYFNRLLKRKIRERTLALEEAMQNLEKSDAVKTRFIRNISHEIRTPMNSILGFSEMLKKQDISRQESLSYTDAIIDNGKHLIRIIDSLLEISSFGNEPAKINYEEIHLKFIFQNIASYFESIARRKNIALNFDTDLPTSTSVVIDRNRTKKIVINLIDNALKFTNFGSVNVNYTIVNNAFLEVVVKDTGKGIKPEDKDIIFESFSKLDTEIVSYFDGLGLGLAIVKENVKALGGTLNFESQLGEGSTFTVKMPCKMAKASSALDIDSTHNRYKVLVVEDADINFMLVKSILLSMKAYDFTILHAENGKIGVEMCAANPDICLVLMDIRMPVMNGYEATRIIKAQFPSLPVLAHTAYSTDGDIQNALDAGCEMVLAKPVEVNLFKSSIIKYMEKGKMLLSRNSS